MVRLECAVPLAVALIICGAAECPSAQTASHQRVGVAARESLEFTVGATLGISASDDAGGAGMELDPSISLDALFMQRFGFSVEVPAVARLALGRDALPGATAAMGDPSIAATYSLRVSDWRLGAELAYSHPLGIWDSRESAEKRITSGMGYPRLGATLTALRYLDPLIAGMRLGAETWLSRQERFGTSTKPLILCLGFFATEALNTAAAVSAGLTQKLAWPRRLDGKPGSAGPAWSLSGSISIVLSEGDRSFRFGVSKLLSDFTAPIALDIGFFHSIKKRE